MRHGPEKDYQNEKNQLLEWVDYNGCGLMGLYTADGLPGDAWDFIYSQFERFGVESFPDKDAFHEVLWIGVDAAIRWVDYYDPYALLSGISDVVYTNDWQQFTYDIQASTIVEEANPEFLETFKFVPGASEKCFNYCMSHPGLDALPMDIGTGIRDIFDGHFNEEVWGHLSHRAEIALKEACTIMGEDSAPQVDTKRMKAHFELAAWAFVVWLIGPLSREFKGRCHEAFDICLQHGECILYEGVFLSPRDYTKHLRKPQSCHSCGLDAWCVEMTQVSGVNRFICEKCLNSHIPKIGSANCGVRICRFVSCSYHPAHLDGARGLHHQMRTSGQLTYMAKDPQAALAGVAPKLITH